MIKLMTIDEIEAWWEAHPEAAAFPSEASRCLIAVPLKAVNDGVAAIGIGPHADEETGEIEVFDDMRLGPVESAVLDPTLNLLALRFDEEEGRADENAGETSLTSEQCLAFIRDFKEEHKDADAR